MKKSELRQIIREEIEKVKSTQTNNIELSPIGYGRSKIFELSFLNFNEAKKIENALNTAGYESETIKSPNKRWDGFVNIKNASSLTNKDIINIARIVEKTTGRNLVNDYGERVSDTGSI